MSEKLKQMTEQWLRMGRQTQEQWAAAEAFYEKELLHLVAEDYVRRNKDKVFEDVEYLVLSVGTSIEPLVLNISLFQPKKVLFLCTTKTEVLLDKIVEHCALSPSAYQKEIVDSTKPTDIYREIKNGYDEISQAKPQRRSRRSLSTKNRFAVWTRMCGKPNGRWKRSLMLRKSKAWSWISACSYG